MNYTTVLDLYSFEEILEHNDVTPEEALEFMIERNFITLPEVQELSFD